jgi:S-adenosylmethionine decarboxylase
MNITELLVEAYGCEGPLNDGEVLCDALRAAAQAVGATVVREATHAYAPHGITAMIFLAESHLLVTTWPEHRYVVAEIFLCNPSMDPATAWRAIADVVRPRDARSHPVVLRISPG